MSEKIKFTKDELILIKARLEAMPDDIKLITLGKKKVIE